MKYLIVLAILFSTINCKPKAQEIKVVNSSENINSVWMLTEFSSFEKNFLVQSKAALNLTSFENASAAMGCNSIGFKYTIKPNRGITFSDGIRTEMACADMKLEDDFLNFLPTIVTYKIAGHNLFLFNSKNEKMVFVAQDWD